MAGAELRWTVSLVRAEQYAVMLDSWLVRDATPGSPAFFLGYSASLTVFQTQGKPTESTPNITVALNMEALSFNQTAFCLALQYLLSSISCDGLTMYVDLISAIVTFHFDNLALGTSGWVIATLQAAMSSGEFALAMATHGLAGPVAGTFVGLSAGATALPDLTVTNSPTLISGPTSVLLTITPSSGLPQGGSIEVVFPLGFGVAAAPSMVVQLSTTTANSPTITYSGSDIQQGCG